MKFGQDHSIETLLVSWPEAQVGACMSKTHRPLYFSMKLCYFQELQLPGFKEVTWSLGRWGLEVNLRHNIPTWSCILRQILDSGTNLHLDLITISLMVPKQELFIVSMV